MIGKRESQVNKNQNDPVVIGYCAACGHPIFSNEDYYTAGDDMIHAEGVGARAKIIGTETNINVSCLLLMLQQDGMEDETAKLFGIERIKV